jgi:hypothetical protein
VRRECGQDRARRRPDAAQDHGCEDDEEDVRPQPGVERGQAVKSSKVLNAALIARLYDCDVESVQFFECDNALAFKATIPRRRVQGDFGDPDLHGGQQHAPLMAVDVSSLQ